MVEVVLSWAELVVGLMYQDELWKRVLATMYGSEVLYYMMTI